MTRALISSGLCLALAATAACSRREATDRPSVADVAQRTDRDHIEVIGCLTADPGTQQFVLTAKKDQLSSIANRSAAGEAETYHYQLMGGNDLASMAGKEVKVTGALVGKGKDVDVAAKNANPAAKSEATDATPVVETTEEVELQVEQLRVASITPTGSECPANR